MPGPIKQADKLDQRAIAANQQVRRHLDALDSLEVGVRRMVELVTEEVFYFAATKLTRRQADIVDDQKRDACSIRTRPEIRRRGPAGEGNPPGFAKRISIGTGG